MSIRRLILGITSGLLALLTSCTARPHHSNSLNGSHANPSGSGIFRNVASEAGLAFKWGHGGRSPLNIVETLGHGCAFLDYDQDGLLDILLVGNDRLALYRNLGNGRFSDVTAKC